MNFKHILATGVWVLAACTAAPAAAQGCSNSGFGPFDFGTLQSSGPTDITSSLAYSCWGGSVTTYVRMCLEISNEGTPAATAGGRRMLGWSGGNQYYTFYDLFSDLARSQKLPTGSGGGNFGFTWDLEVPANTTLPKTQPIYARAYAPAPGTPATTYNASGLATYVRFAWGTGGYPPNCQAGSNKGSFTQTGATASSTVGNSCSIAISQTSDMDFGSAASLTSAVESTSTISLSCPTNTSWKLGLSDGMNAVVAGKRRMAGPALDFIEYELYQDAGRSERWGNDTAGGTNTVNGPSASQSNPTVLTVYGRVRAQPTGTPGTYMDTVTVTLTY